MSNHVEVFSLGDVTQICRLCLNSNDEIQPLEESPLLEQLRRLSKLKIDLGSKLPKKICQQCMDRLIQLRQVARFMAHCRRAQNILKVFFDNATTTGKCVIKVETKNEQDLIIRTEIIRGIIPEPDTGIKVCKNLTSKKPEKIPQPLKELNLEEIVNAANNETDRNKSEEKHTNAENRNEPVKAPKKRSRCKICTARCDDLTQHRIDFPKCAQLFATKQMCEDCGRMVKNLENHKLTKVCSLACNQCDYVGIVRNDLIVHYTNVHGIPRKKCKVRCQKCDCLVDDLQKHREDSPACRKSQEEKKQVMCDRCGTVVAQSSLSTHQIGSACTLACLHCNYVASTALDLRKHMSTEHGTKKLVCPKCKQEVLDLLVHRVENKACQLECDLCDRTFVQKQILRTHKLSHLDVGQYTCEQCSAKFKYYANYKRHMRVHQLGPHFQCTLCPRSE